MSKKPGRGSRWRRRLGLRPDALWWLYVGVVIMVAGFGLITYAWVRVAALNNVAFQIPYLISSTVGGLVIVRVGLGIVDATLRRRDALERSTQLGQLRDLLQGIADSLEQDREEGPALEQDEAEEAS